jgi:cytochrome P450
MDAQQIFTALIEPAGMTDPYPLYTAMRELGDVVPGPGLVFVAGYEAASGVLRDSSFLVADAEMFDQVSPGWRDHPSLNAESMLNINGEVHARIRALMARQFTHRRVQGLEPAVTRLTDSLLDAMAERAGHGEPVDFMAEFAFALPVAVICELLGVPDTERDALRSLGHSLTALLEPLYDQAALADGDLAAVRLAELFGDLVAQRRASPQQDLISQFVAACDDSDARISPSELIQNLILLLLAGFETTTNLLGNGLRVALTQPEAGEAVRSGGVSAEGFVEEVLRYDAPVQVTGRRLRAPGELGGAAVSPDDQVVVMLAAANRDPARFADPDVFRPERTDGGPLSFGAGAHFCLGAPLARMEGAVAFPRLLRRFPEIATAGEPERRLGLTFRGFERLPVSLGRSSPDR